MPLKKGLNLGERPNLLFHLLKSVLFDMCLLSESVDQLNNVIVNKGTRMGRLLHFLTRGDPLARFARESSAIKYHFNL